MAYLIEDVFGGIAHIMEHAAEYGGDPTKIGITGDSAGGHLSASLAIRRSEILPSWLGVFGYVAAVAALFSVVFFTMLVWLLWIAAASVALFLRVRQAAAPQSAPAPAV